MGTERVGRLADWTVDGREDGASGLLERCDRVTSAVEGRADELTHAGVKDDLASAFTLPGTIKRERTAHRFTTGAHMENASDEKRCRCNSCAARFNSTQ